MRFSALVGLLLFLSFNLFAVEQSLEVIVKKADLVSADPKIKVAVIDIFTLNGYRQALTREMGEKGLDSEKFWKKFEEKNLTDSEEQNLLKPYFSNITFLTSKPNPEEPFEKALFKYELDSSSAKTLFDQMLSDAPNMTVKTFYILPEIGIDREMGWSDVGVSKKENFSGVIVDSWKKWAEAQFKNFPNVVILEKDFNAKPDNINNESVTLKWNSLLKKSEIFQDRKSARFEMTAQYVLVNTKTNQTLTSFDFPTQKREYGIFNPKELSSNLASLTYNLLNSQTAKITSALEHSQSTGAMEVAEIKITGKHGLFEITQLNNLLMERFKSISLSAELKSYSSSGSVISIKSSINTDALTALFAKDGGKFPLNEQKILLFSPQDRAFAIIPKEANN